MKKFFLSIAIATTLVGCSNEDTGLNNGPVELKATVENSTMSRVGFDNASNWSFFWHSGDEIWVNTGIMTTDAADKSATASFSGYGVETASGYAAYPYNGTKLKDNELTIKFPATYSTIDNDYFESTQNVAMYAVVENGSATFKHLGGVFVFKFNGWEITGDQVFTLTSSKRITGEFVADLTAETPILVTDQADQEDMVTVNFTTTATSDIVFYVPVPTGTYDIDLSIKANGNTKFSKSYENFTVNRTSICYAEYGESTLVGGGGATVETAEALTDALEDGGEIKLNAEINITEGLVVKTNTVIDLNGNNLSLGNKTINVAEGAVLTIKDSQTPSTFARSRTAVANVTISSSGDIITAAPNSTINIGEGVNLITTGANSCCIFVPGKNEPIANNVTINTAGNLLAKESGSATIYINGNVTSGTINITGGSIKHEKDLAIYIAGKVDLNVTGGEIEGTTGVEIRAGKLNVTGGTIKATASTFGATANNNGSTSTGAAVAIAQHSTNHELKAVISGGTFEGVKALYEEDTCDENVSGISMEVTGGTFNGEISSENCNGFIKGGTFSDASVFSYLAPVAEVTLGADMTLSKLIKVKTDLTVNLNGKTLKHPKESTAPYKEVFDVGGTGILTVNGEGKVIAENGYSVYAYGKVVLNGGYYFSPMTTVYATQNANVIINGGEFKVDGTNNPEGDKGQTYTLNKYDRAVNAQIIVKGGKFYKFNPANNAAEGEDTNFVAPGYSSVANGDYYEVKVGIFNETALNAAIVNGAEITLDDDMTIAKAITIPTGITATINLNGFDVTAPNTDAFEVAGTLTIKDTNNEGVVSAGTEHPNAGVCAVWANGGNVTIEGGHYMAYSDASGKRNDCIYAGYNADNNNTAGKITINGGKFEYVWPTTKTSGLDYNGDMFLLNCADKDLYQTLITVNGGQFKNNAPSYEATTPQGRTDNEVKLGAGKKVYNGETEVTAAHNGTTDIWYVVK